MLRNAGNSPKISPTNWWEEHDTLGFRVRDVRGMLYEAVVTVNRKPAASNTLVSVSSRGFPFLEREV